MATEATLRSELEARGFKNLAALARAAGFAPMTLHTARTRQDFSPRLIAGIARVLKLDPNTTRAILSLRWENEQ